MSISTPLGSYLDTIVDWLPWLSVMTFVGLLALQIFVTSPISRRVGADLLVATQHRLTRTAAVAAIGYATAFVIQLAYEAGDKQRLDIGHLGDAVGDGFEAWLTVGALLAAIAAAVVLCVATIRRQDGPHQSQRGAGIALALGSGILVADKFPSSTPTDWPRTVFSTVMWSAHLLGAALWLGGLVGLFALLLPGAVHAEERAPFWSPTLRRFSLIAMGSVAGITLSGLWLYWLHVDGLSQLLSTMYGRVLGVKILIFGSVLLLGVFNQFWMEPKLAGMRAAGEAGSKLTLALRHLRTAVAVEVLLVLAVLFVAPFLHGSARNQAFQQTYVDQQAAERAPLPKKLPKAPAKKVDASTWVYGTAETIAVIGGMAVAWAVSGRAARRRIAAATSPREDTSQLLTTA